MRTVANPFYASRGRGGAAGPAEAIHSAPVARSQDVTYARLPRAPITASPVPHLTSLYHSAEAGSYGSRSYPGNCGGNLIKDLIRFYRPRSVVDPMTGSGTCADVCRELSVYCYSSDLPQGTDACDPSIFPRGCFEFAWLHPPYWRQKVYSAADDRDLSRTPTLDALLDRYRQLIATAAGTLVSSGRLAILMGDYHDREAGFVPLVYHTKRLAFDLGLRQCATDIVRFGHGASSGRKVYRSSFIPGLHDVCTVFAKGSDGR
jgi:hypothetical protein